MPKICSAWDPFKTQVGLVDATTLKPGDLVGVNKDSYLILDTLPAEYDSRVKAMEVDEKPTEDYSDVGGLDKQIQELVEAIVLPIQHKDRFIALGIRPPKGVLLYGPPGTGKTLIARAVAAQTNATFLKLAGPQLVQMFIGDGAKMVRDAFALAKEKSPCIIFIDEIDAIGTKRFDSELSGDREVQRTMLELLNQLDGFSSAEDVKVCEGTCTCMDVCMGSMHPAASVDGVRYVWLHTAHCICCMLTTCKWVCLKAVSLQEGK